MNKVVHRPHGKTEPVANKYRPQTLAALAALVSRMEDQKPEKAPKDKP
jgi:hypothetical protein